MTLGLLTTGTKSLGQTNGYGLFQCLWVVVNLLVTEYTGQLISQMKEPLRAVQPQTKEPLCLLKSSNIITLKLQDLTYISQVNSLFILITIIVGA
jgi:hypothetical protein